MEGGSVEVGRGFWVEEVDVDGAPVVGKRGGCHLLDYGHGCGCGRVLCLLAWCGFEISQGIEIAVVFGGGEDGGVVGLSVRWAYSFETI